MVKKFYRVLGTYRALHLPSFPSFSYINQRNTPLTKVRSRVLSLGHWHGYFFHPSPDQSPYRPEEPASSLSLLYTLSAGWCLSQGQYFITLLSVPQFRLPLFPISITRITSLLVSSLPAPLLLQSTLFISTNLKILKCCFCCITPYSRLSPEHKILCLDAQ